METKSHYLEEAKNLLTLVSDQFNLDLPFGSLASLLNERGKEFSDNVGFCSYVPFPEYNDRE